MSVNYVCVGHSRYKVLRRRVIWMSGQWINVKFARQTRPVLYQVLLKLMNAQEDLVVRHLVYTWLSSQSFSLCIWFKLHVYKTCPVYNNGNFMFIVRLAFNLSHQKYNKNYQIWLVISRPNLSTDRTCLSNWQYASFTRAVIGQSHLNGFLFSWFSVKRKLKCYVFIHQKTFNW